MIPNALTNVNKAFYELYLKNWKFDASLIFRRWIKHNAHRTEQTRSLWFGISLKMAEHLVKSTSQCTRHLDRTQCSCISHHTCWFQSLDECVKRHVRMTMFSHCFAVLIKSHGLWFTHFFCHWLRKMKWQYFYYYETWYPISHYQCRYFLRCVKTLLNYPWLSSLGMSLI